MKCEYSKRECCYTPVATAFSCYLCAVHDAYKQGTADANENRPHGNWEYLKEHITEMRDSGGCLNQKETCQFILNLMGVIEREDGMVKECFHTGSRAGDTLEYLKEMVDTFPQFLEALNTKGE